MDKIAVTKEDFCIAGDAFRFTENDFGSIPLSFVYGGRLVSGIPEEFSPVVLERRSDLENGKTTIVITGRNAEGLEIVAHYNEYRDFPVYEWLFFLSNVGDAKFIFGGNEEYKKKAIDADSSENTPVIENVRVGGKVLKGSSPVLYHGNGDVCTDMGYEMMKDPVDRELVYAPDFGVSCCGAMPYFRLIFNEYCVNAAVGWPGGWEAGFIPAEEGVELYAKQKNFRAYLKPGETVRTPRLTVMFTSGNEDRSRNVWRRWMLEHIVPKKNGEPIKPLHCLHTWLIDGKEEFTGVTEENQLFAIDEYIRKGLKPDVWWIDAGWYPCDGHWVVTGNWWLDPERFPEGLGKVGQKCVDNDILLLLWFELERVHVDTWLDKNRPEWIIREPDEGRMNVPSFNLLNLGNSDCLEWAVETIDRIIKDSHVGIYRQDFNFAPANAWRSADEKDRDGMTENKHIVGYLKLWDSLLERNPGLIIDSCSSGGRRNDLETMRRGIPLHYTDVGYGVHPVKQKQHRMMFEWIPYFRAHAQNWDDDNGDYTPGAHQPVDEYAYHCAMAPALTSMIEYYDGEELFAVGKKMVPVWRRAAEYMLSGDYYPLTECRKSNEDYYAMQFDIPEKGEGFVQVVRNTKAEEDVFVLRPVVDEASDYCFENGETGETFVESGRKLAEGVRVNIPKRSGIIYFYRKQ
ncbi:MAG: alpha-galactosidase [Clostridia bacterium]|nr:alpha-galactosidase [Clostridia bacterium]